MAAAGMAAAHEENSRVYHTKRRTEGLMLTHSDLNAHDGCLSPHKVSVDPRTDCATRDPCGKFMPLAVAATAATDSLLLSF